MERAKIFYAEDSATVRKALTGLLSDFGHEVVIEVDNLEDGLASIEKARELGIHAAIVDGNLSPNDISCEDGRTLSAALKETLPKVVIIANTSEKDCGYGDVFANKLSMDAPQLILDTINAIKED